MSPRDSQVVDIQKQKEEAFEELKFIVYTTLWKRALIKGRLNNKINQK